MSRSLVFLSALASHAHSNLAHWKLRAYCERGAGSKATQKWSWHELEITQQDSLHAALIQLVRLRPDLLAATFYLFNRNLLLALLSRYKALFPDCRLVLGGPEFLGDNRIFCQRHPYVDALIRGEGEIAFAELLQCIEQPQSWSAIPGFCGLRAGRYIDNGLAPCVKRLDDLPSPYPAYLDSFRKPFIQLEASRGCANQCTFCTSAGVALRYLSLDRVRQDLDLIAAAQIQEVRLLDRTFNDRPARCIPLLRILRDEFKTLKFHLEIDPARITPAILKELGAAAPARFHLEIGVQTLSQPVLRILRRRGSAARLLKGTQALCRLGNLKTHLDLIAGLPGATLPELLRDLELLISLNPDAIQLEILKLLPGTPLELNKQRWGIIAAPEPPYEVLETASMSAAEIEKARRLSMLVDWFFNVEELRQPTLLATRSWPNFWQELINSGARRLEQTNAPSLENRFRWLADLFQEQPADLLHSLHYAWMKYGFSAQHGICPAKVWKGAVPVTASLIEGEPTPLGARRFVVQLDQPTLFVYGSARRACAIYRLPS